MHRITKIAVTSGVAVAALIATMGTASASVAIDATGKGFVGKGDVQSAFALNNAQMQKAVEAKAFSFSAEQPTTQSLSQAVSQVGTQSGSQSGTMAVTQTATQSATQAVSQDLVCTYTNGSDKNTKYFHRDGERDGSRTGTRTGERQGVREGARTGERDGTRTGSQSGKQVGSVANDLNVTDKKTGQYTGFNLKGFTGTPVSSNVGSPVWDAPSFDGWEFGAYNFGDYTFGAAHTTGDYSFGEYTFAPLTTTVWGDWDAAPGENPADCLRSENAGHITEISNVISEGAITDGAIVDGSISDGAATDGAISDGDIREGNLTLIDPVHAGEVTNDGAAKVFVTYNGARKGL